MSLVQQSFDRAQQTYDNMDDSPRGRSQEQQQAYDNWLESKADETRDKKTDKLAARTWVGVRKL
jgi:hypothetical protein